MINSCKNIVRKIINSTKILWKPFMFPHNHSRNRTTFLKIMIKFIKTNSVMSIYYFQNLYRIIFYIFSKKNFIIFDFLNYSYSFFILFNYIIFSSVFLNNFYSNFLYFRSLFYFVIFIFFIKHFHPHFL